ncbi:MAG: hypothetical protein JNG85_14125, partial [Spirochaetaceae bacterium]|nr:hypothetical protein [Spirochaetaceae bacterium]
MKPMRSLPSPSASPGRRRLALAFAGGLLLSGCATLGSDLFLVRALSPE